MLNTQRVNVRINGSWRGFNPLRSAEDIETCCGRWLTRHCQRFNPLRSAEDIETSKGD